jgi:hypothetical protein
MMAPSVEEAVRASRIIVGGLMAGLLLFMAVAMVIAPLSRAPDPTFTAMLLGSLGVLAAGCAGGYRVVRRSIVGKTRTRLDGLTSEGDAVPLAIGPYRELVIVRGGLTEGPAFFALVTYMLTGNVLALGVAGAALILLGAHFPSTDEMRAFTAEAMR